MANKKTKEVETPIEKKEEELKDTIIEVEEDFEVVEDSNVKQTKEKKVEVINKEGKVVRVYTEEEGKDFEKKAKEFAEKNSYKTN